MRFSDELWRDLSSLRRHVWLLIVVLILALAAAGASFLLAPAPEEASFRDALILSSLPPLFGPDTLPSADAFARLSLSEEALQKTSDILREKGIDLPPDVLKSGLSARARQNQSAIDFRVSLGDSDLSLAVARAWNDVFAELAPARAPDLQREASAAYQAQIERAQAELEQKRQQLAALGVVSGSGGETANPTQATYEAKAAALAEKEVERTEIGNLLETLRGADPASLSADQLRLLLAGILPPEAALGAGFTVQQAIATLELRALSLDGTILALAQEVRQLGSTLDSSGTEVQQALTELEAAEENYQVASRLAQSYEVVGDLLQVGVFTVQEPHLAETGLLPYASRFAAAGAFALVAGVLGALGLAQLPGRGNKRPPARRVSAVPARLPQNPARDQTYLPSRLHKRRRYRTGSNAYLQFSTTALAVLLLVGLLGTLSRRKTLRHRPR